MNYHQFVKDVEAKVRACVPENWGVQVHIAMKNNGKERRGLTVIEEGINISPTIYLEEYYEQFQNGNSIEQIVEEIMILYRKVRFRKPWEGTCMQTFESVKKKLAYKLINREKNKELLKEVPYKPFLDLAIVCYVLLELNAHGTATMLIKKEHLQMWNVTEEEIFRETEKNVRSLLPAEFSRMRDVIAEMLDMEVEDDGEEFMYVLSNEVRSFGAACLAYEGVTEMVAEELGENYYVIPSSVHEVIIVPESKAPDKYEMEETVAEINETQVEAEEVLSDRVYFYSIKEKRLL